MSRGKPAIAIPMTSRYYQLLQENSQKRTISHEESFRSKILVFAHEGKSNMAIARTLQTTVNTVKKWRKRWLNCYEQILLFESGINQKGVSDKELLQRLLAVIQDEPRSGTPKRITLEQENQIVAISCKKPKDYGIIMNKWTHEQIANVAIKEGVIDSISSRYVGTILKKNSLPYTFLTCRNKAVL